MLHMSEFISVHTHLKWLGPLSSLFRSFWALEWPVIWDGGRSAQNPQGFQFLLLWFQDVASERNGCRVFCPGQRMPFADNSFDLIWSLESGEHMPQKSKTLGTDFKNWLHWLHVDHARALSMHQESPIHIIHILAIIPLQDATLWFCMIFHVTEGNHGWSWGQGLCLRCIVCASPAVESSWWPGFTGTCKMVNRYDPRRPICTPGPDRSDRPDTLWWTNIAMENHHF